jgi:hypothetical protein
MKQITFFLLFLSLAISAFAQEMNCQISVTTRQVEGTDRQVYNTMQTALFELMNTKKWTNYQYRVEERIESTMMINVTERVSTDEFKGTMNVVSRRPVYKSSYNSPMINYIDNAIQFNYAELEPLEFQDNTITSNLTALIAYYTYIIIGLDFDSYNKFGGTPYFEKAQNIVNLAQNTSQRGWKSFESQKNRYWLAENLNNSSYVSLREFMYNYHRLGLDLMAEDLERGRSAIMDSFEFLQRAYRDKPSSFLLQLILDAKRDEFINIFSGAPDPDKVKAVNILKEIDPANSSKYQKILEK